MTSRVSEGRSISTRAWKAMLAGLLVAWVSVAPAAVRANDVVMDWNDVARQLVVPAGSPVEQTRAMAIVQVAVHDAVSAITGGYEPYRRTAVAPAGASVEAAVIAAAYTALRGTVGSSDLLTSSYASSLATYEVSPDDPGLAFGQAVAEGILALRHPSVDGSGSAIFAYTAPGAGQPGVWTPISDAASAQALLPGWGDVAPWVLRSASQFRPDPPAAVGSDEYVRDLEEVRQVGARSDTDQQRAQIASFWRASPTAIWNPVLRQAIRSRGLSLAETARIMALFYLASADASVACWEAKYFYNFWRPQAAIAHAWPGSGWMPRVTTAPHPEYPSGHTANSGAMAAVLQTFFGDAPGFVIEATSSQTPGVVRHWQSFSEGVQEVVDARVYSGIHFRTSDEVGVRLGRQVAQFVLTHTLRPVRPPRVP